MIYIYQRLVDFDGVHVARSTNHMDPEGAILVGVPNSPTDHWKKLRPTQGWKDVKKKQPTITIKHSPSIPFSRRPPRDWPTAHHAVAKSAQIGLQEDLQKNTKNIWGTWTKPWHDIPFYCLVNRDGLYWLITIPLKFHGITPYVTM